MSLDCLNGVYIGGYIGGYISGEREGGYFRLEKNVSLSLIAMSAPPSSLFRLSIRKPQSTRSLISMIFLVVGFLEFSTPPPYVFGYLYIGAVLLASARLSRRETLAVSGMAVFLTLLNLVVPGVAEISLVTLANRTITVLALVVTGVLSDRLQCYEAALNQKQLQILAQSQLAKVREDFVSTLTHDLKTPMLGAIATLEALQQERFGSLNPRQRRTLEVMERSHHNSLRLVETLTDIYRNDNHGLELHYGPLDLRDLANSVMAELTALSLSRQVTMRLTSGRDHSYQSCPLEGDALQLRRVFSNLLVNAIHHCRRQGTVEVEIVRRGDRYQVRIRDEGQGLDETDLQHLFERFYQGTSDRQAKGTGLGLYLSRQIVEAHHGRIWAERYGDSDAQGSQPLGAVFVFELPTPVQESLPISARSPQSQS